MDPSTPEHATLSKKKIKTPKHLGDIGKRKFRDLLKLLGGTIGDNEVDSLALLAGSWELYLTAHRSVLKEGTMMKSARNGRWFANPNVAIANEAWRQIVALSKLFNFSPRTSAAGDEQPPEKWRGLVDEEG